MNPLHQHIAFLCGHFTMSGSLPVQELVSLGWEKYVQPDDIRNIAKRFFYPEYVDFCYAKETDNASCIRFVKNVNEEINIYVKDKEIHFAVKEITLYIMPFKMAMFSIHIEQDTDDLNDCTRLLSCLRSVSGYSDCYRAFVEKAIEPFMKVYEILTGKEPAGCSELIENGNKFRIFQIVNSHDEKLASLPEEDKDLLLYELATVTKITKPNEISEDAASDSYMKRIIERNKISIFRNWSGLALMDTFTIHAFNASNVLIENWLDSYFQMIYIHCIFQKNYLFNLNIRFRKTMAQPAPLWKAKLQRINVGHIDIDQLVDEYESFEQRCCFHKISYNFLPLEIADAMDKGLEIKEEMTLLYKVMEREKTRKDEANDKMVNTLLFSLSLLTLFSAIWDITCLLDQMFPYAEYLGGQLLGYRTVALFMLLAVSFIFFVIYKGNRFRK